MYCTPHVRDRPGTAVAPTTESVAKCDSMVVNGGRYTEFYEAKKIYCALILIVALVRSGSLVHT